MRVGVHGADRQPSSESAVRGGTRRFLTAEWRDLAMLSYQVDPGILADRVPLGTMLDSFEGRHFVSVVGFRFIDTRVFGIPVPFHRDFDEVNLRFYVRRETGAGARRGVVFIKEIVPRVAITNIARWVYNENYVAMLMRSGIRRPTPKESPVGIFEYGWGSPDRWHHMKVRTSGTDALPPAESLETFFAEHYWGYGVRRDGSTLEYVVEHPPWRLWRAAEASLHCAAGQVYGHEFDAVLRGQPVSAFVALGSAVSVRLPVKL